MSDDPAFRLALANVHLAYRKLADHLQRDDCRGCHRCEWLRADIDEAERQLALRQVAA